MGITGGIATDFDGIYNTIPVKGFLDLRTRKGGHFGKGDVEPEMVKKELLKAAKAGDSLAIEILKIRYKLKEWWSEGIRII